MVRGGWPRSGAGTGGPQPSDLALVLELLARELRGGATITAAMGALPSGADLGLRDVRRRIDDGAAIGDELDRWSASIPGGDGVLVRAVLRLGLSTGAALADSLDRTAAVVRERGDLADELRALSAQSRASATMIAGAPAGFLAVFALADPAALSFPDRDTPRLGLSRGRRRPRRDRVLVDAATRQGGDPVTGLRDAVVVSSLAVVVAAGRPGARPPRRPARPAAASRFIRTVRRLERGFPSLGTLRDREIVLGLMVAAAAGLLVPPLIMAGPIGLAGESVRRARRDEAAHQRALVHALPSMIDQLGLAVGAGLTLPAALRQVRRWLDEPIGALVDDALARLDARLVVDRHPQPPRSRTPDRGAAAADRHRRGDPRRCAARPEPRPSRRPKRDRRGAGRPKPGPGACRC